ncbi:MAG: T9SS type A sorting domain-containing protein, partial [Ignavibacteria bacterium]|nr:T9SS type A sorting domain-containing protein [Ignavibacteria bacterium]
KNFSDTQDSLNVKVVYNNFGLATSNTYKILIQAYYKNTINYTREIIKPLPEYVDSVTLKIPVKGLNGEHKISVTLDSGGSVNEIYENDNVASMDFIVPSGSVKYLVASQVENYVKNPLRILSPLKEKNLPDVIVELATDENFINSTKYQIRLDTIKTDFNIDNSFANKRAWMRTKLNQYDSTASVISLKPTNKNSFAIFDSLSFSKQNYANFKVGNKLTLDSIYISFKLLSAGLNDGNTALILKDGQNHIPENTLRGHHVAIFKGKNYQFAGYKLFDVYGGGSAVTNEYIKFLDTLSSDYLVAFTLSDEGTISSTPLRNKIKEFGSKYIDNVSFRSSWVMLGRKGAKTGSVPEKYAKQYQGRVEVDTVILSNSRTGKLQTNTIGPAGKWKQLNLGLTGATNYFGLSLLGANGVNYDTLISTTDRKVNYDLSAINPVKYPYLKVNLSLGSENINDVIKFDSLIVDYLKPPELVISNRTTTISKDTLRQGEKITLIYPVYNSGETTAKNFKVTHQIVRSDGYKIMESGAAIDSLKPDERKNLSVIYDTRNLIGSYYFVINLDPDRSLNEIYTDNNYLTVPFYVKGDESIPLVQVKFDDVDIFDGDFISSTPDIKISLSSSSIIPLTDTTSIEIQLNNERIYFKNNSTINYSFADTNPKMIINYKPVLDEGEYLFKVVAKNPNNSTMESTTVQKKFLVSKNAKLLYVYNYPNPFSDETFFTFKLTQIPDELKIRIYTLAGRLIKEIVRNEGELNYDFNRIEWDGKDEDGSSIANGVYIYKVIMKKGSEVITATQKLAVIR